MEIGFNSENIPVTICFVIIGIVMMFVSKCINRK